MSNNQNTHARKKDRKKSVIIKKNINFASAPTAGLCGGFTTFSTFSNDIVEMTRQGDWAGSLTYIILSIIIGALACMAGSFISK